MVRGLFMLAGPVDSGWRSGIDETEADIVVYRSKKKGTLGNRGEDLLAYPWGLPSSKVTLSRSSERLPPPL